MINFNDVTGLASNTLAISAIAIKLIVKFDLRRSSVLIIASGLVILVLIPIYGLPLAAYSRGWMGDLSVTSLVLLLMSMNHNLNGSSPLGKPQAIGLLIEPVGRQALLSLIALSSMVLYPISLGMGYFDIYSLGYGNTGLLCSLLLLAVTAVFMNCGIVALAIALAVLAWSVGWYESTNLWDYLLDPLLAIYALSVIISKIISYLKVF